ncbi:MAG TPA: S41 family peptidase [Polyangiaceae bacterium]|nr:S41 family peptidase [Polyangiaceae bacterium]
MSKSMSFLVVVLLGTALFTGSACRTGRSTPADSSPASSAPPAATGPSGDSPASRQFAAWLAAFNDGDGVALRAYHQLHFPFEVASRDVGDSEREMRLRTVTGGFDVQKLETASATSFSAILKERRRPQFARAAMDVDAADPHRVVRFEIAPIATPDEFLSADERARSTVDEARRHRIIDGVARHLEAHYVFPEVAERMIAALRDHAARGDYDRITSAATFSKAVTDDLRQVSHDQHLRLIFSLKPPPPPSPPDGEQVLGEARAHHFGLGPIERLPGNIARLVINRFVPAEHDAVREAIGALMSQVADADALLVDLRENNGGYPETVALVASYLFDPEPVHLNDMYRRDDRSTREFWTKREVPGKRFGGKKPVFVLTSKRTFSGGEELAYDLQSLHRARVVGETTGGGANPAGPPYEADDGFMIAVPWGRPINPITKTNWEGVGVIPDVPVPASAALDKARELAQQQLAAAPPAR